MELLNSKQMDNTNDSPNNNKRSPSPDTGGRTPPGANSGSKQLWIDDLKRGARETIHVNFALRQLFGKYGTVENVDLKITTSSRMKGTACVTMTSAAEAVEACRHMNGRMVLDQGPIKVSICDPNT
eukprot:UN34606